MTSKTATGTQSDGIKLGVERIRALLTRVGEPQRRFPVIHVAGTNGKGSTIFYLDRILRNVVGLQVGSFTSPHVRYERDACQVNGKPIDPIVWQKATEVVKDAVSSSSSSQDPSESPFERLTAQSFVAFDMLTGSQRPDVLLVEVGMGGALDATNVFDDQQVLASVITAIDFDHQALLGTTLEAIATHKAGIIKQDGLCILADQRRESTQDEVDCTRIATQTQQGHSDDVEEIVQAVRRIGHDRHARLVKGYVPWHCLSHSTRSTSPASWSVVVESNVRFSPILSTSKIHPGHFVASTGDNVVAGPQITVPATRAALMGAHVALQTLFSIARDESPFAKGMLGSDAFEGLRLQIAFALRDDRLAQRALQAAIHDEAAAERFAGRAEWVNVKLKAADPTAVEATEEDDAIDIADPESQPIKITALLDGAHNPSAAVALRHYVDACIAAKNDSAGPLTITWILAFSRGKNIEGMVHALLGSHVAGDLNAKVQSMSLDGQASNIVHRIACVPFTTPVEGMPWVECTPPEEIKSQITSALPMLSEHIRTFDEGHPIEALQQALLWASQTGKGTPDSSSMIVIAGSLYLVSDVHRSLITHV